MTWRRPDGVLETWSSRVARKRAALDGRAAARPVARRQRLLNNEEVANWGTFSGALCFAIGGLLQAFGRPRTADADRRP